jgi:Tfp pilus assembly protein PilV
MRILKNKKGFTISEVVIAITVLTTVILATSQMAISSIKTADSSLKRYSAMHIAEEGLEIVRVIRDSNWLQNRPWQEGLKEGKYDIAENRMISSELPWKLNSIPDETAAREITLGENQRLKRVIVLRQAQDDSGATTSINVESRVKYFVGSAEKELSVETVLTNWKKGPL